jgi:hypothetical protein
VVLILPNDVILEKLGEFFTSIIVTSHLRTIPLIRLFSRFVLVLPVHHYRFGIASSKSSSEGGF